MAALTNPKHERFAQALAKGSTATDAYAEAGYKPHDSNAARLSGNDRIQARVTELLERAAHRVEISVATVTERLLKIAEKGEGSAEAPLLSVARAALMDAAKLNGLVPEKKPDVEVNVQNRVEVDPKTLADAVRAVRDEF